MAMTLAKIGRSMKNLDMRPDSYVLNIKKTSGGIRFIFSVKF
jgi:hypothetical protein